MLHLLSIGVLAATMAFAPSNNGFQPSTKRHGDTVYVHHHDRKIVHGTAEAFRTGGSAVVYGTRSIGRAFSGRHRDERDLQRMRSHARETRRDYRGY